MAINFSHAPLNRLDISTFNDDTLIVHSADILSDSRPHVWGSRHGTMDTDEKDTYDQHGRKDNQDKLVRHFAPP